MNTLFFIILMILLGLWVAFSIMYNSANLYDFLNKKVLERPTKFLYEDGNYYWFVIEKSSDMNKISVYNKNPLSLRWFLLINGDSCRINYRFVKSYNEETIESPIKSILDTYIKSKSIGLKNFKGYVGDIPKSMIRDSKLKDLGI